MKTFFRNIILGSALALVANTLHAQYWTVETVAGNGTIAWEGEGSQASTGAIGRGLGLFYDSTEHALYVATGHPIPSSSPSTNRIIEIDLEADVMNTWIGTGDGTATHTDGEPPGTTNSVSYPVGIYKTPQGDIFFTEFSGQYIRHYDPVDDNVYDIAGTGSFGYSGNGLEGYTQSHLIQTWNPLAIQISPLDGNLYWISYKGIRMYDFTSGEVKLVYGNIAGSCDPNTARDSLVDGMTVSSSTCLYPAGGLAIADNGDMYFSTLTHAIQKIDVSENTLWTVAGIQNVSSANCAGGGYNGDTLGKETLLNTPYGVRIGPDGKVWWAETGNGIIRRLNDDGYVETVLGKDAVGSNCGDRDYQGDYINADTVRMGPYDLAFGKDGEIYVFDGVQNERVLKFYQCNEYEYDGLSDYISDPCPGVEVDVSVNVDLGGSYDSIYWRINDCYSDAPIDTGLTATITYEQGETYFVGASPLDGCESLPEFCESIPFGGECEISVTAFSPNGDNVNDSFIIDPAPLYPKNYVTIFNRYGDEVWFVDDYDNEANVWSGETNNGQAKSGTYYYIFETDPDAPESIMYKGWVQVVK